VNDRRHFETPFMLFILLRHRWYALWISINQLNDFHVIDHEKLCIPHVKSGGLLVWFRLRF
jgi:hypothetical protein